MDETAPFCYVSGSPYLKKKKKIFRIQFSTLKSTINTNSSRMQQEIQEMPLENLNVCRPRLNRLVFARQK